MKAKDEALTLYLLLLRNNCFFRHFTEQRSITITITILVPDVGFFFCVHLIQQLHSKILDLLSMVLQELGVFSGFFCQLLKLLAYLVMVDKESLARNNVMNLTLNFNCWLFCTVCLFFFIYFFFWFCLFVCIFVSLFAYLFVWFYFYESDLMLIASCFATYSMVHPTSLLSILLIIKIVIIDSFHPIYKKINNT